MNSTETLDDFHAACQRMGLQLTPQQRQQFAAYHKLLLEWNARINLVSREDQHRIFTRHFLDALSILPHLRLRLPCRAADLGSGAGLPGVPLKIVVPELEITLIESKRKKALFLERLCAELGLDSCTVAHARAEALAAASEHCSRYRLIFARAVTSTARLCLLAEPLLASGGLLVCYKGVESIDELADSPSEGLRPYACISLGHTSGRPAAFVVHIRT